MALKSGQEVVIKDPKYMLGKIIELTESNPTNGDVYLVEIEAKTLRLRTSKSDLRQLLMELAALSEGFDENADLYTELGVASMKAMELLMELEDRFQVSVPDEEFIQATSLQGLAEMIQRLKG